MTPKKDDLDQKIAAVGVAAAAAKKTNVTIVLDRSGSMAGIRSDIVGGVNSLIAEQQAEPGNCSFTLWTFDDVSIEMVVKDQKMTDVQPLTDKDYVPRGTTPLYDAVGSALAEAESRHQAGDHEIFVIVTDGLENASKEWTKERVFAKIKEYTNQGWVFSYIGAGHDAYQASHAMGISRGSTQSVAASADSAVRSFASVSRAAKSYRGATMTGDAVAMSSATTDFFGGVKEGEEAQDVPPVTPKSGLVSKGGTGSAHRQ